MTKEDKDKYPEQEAWIEENLEWLAEVQAGR